MVTRRIWALCMAASGFLCSMAVAQEKAAATPSRQAVYDLKLESTVVGTVVSYTQASKTPPNGPHVVLQTGSGNLDVQMGDARFLQANHFTIQSGDTLRIIGENVAFGTGTQFVARVLQKGTQALEVRSVGGFPLSYVAPRNDAGAKKAGVL